MGGHLTDLINMADCQEWKGQRFKKKHVRKLKYCFTQYDGKLFSNLVHLNDKNLFNMRNGEVYIYGRFVLTFCVFDFDFVFRFCIFVSLSETATASSSHKM